MPPRKPQKNFTFHRQPPDLPSDLTTLIVPTDPSTLFTTPKISIADHHLENLTIPGSATTTFHLESSLLERVSLANARFATLLWKDVRLVHCDLANLELDAMTLVRVEFVDCRMTGLRAGKADLQDVLIAGGDQRYAQFRFGHLQATECDNANLAEADFYGTDLSGTRFRSCNLQRAEMSKTKLVNADLRGSQIDGLQLAAEDIRGAIVDPAQALSLAHLLGIQIK